MDAVNIEALLDEGMIGEISFASWLRQVRVEPDEGIAHIAHALSEFGIMSMRWVQWQQSKGGTVARLRKASLRDQTKDSHPASIQEQKPNVWIAYLVVTLPAQLSREEIFDIAVFCRSFTFFVKDPSYGANESKGLWIEYQVARPEVTARIEEVLAAGKIGEVPFIPWIVYRGASTDLKTMAGSLAGYGVTSIDFKPPSEWEAQHSHNWKSYLVVSLPSSPWASAAQLPSHELVHHVAMVLRSPENYSAWRYELRVGYEVQLPVDNKFEKWLAYQRSPGKL